MAAPSSETTARAVLHSPEPDRIRPDHCDRSRAPVASARRRRWLSAAPGQPRPRTPGPSRTVSGPGRWSRRPRRRDGGRAEAQILGASTGLDPPPPEAHYHRGSALLHPCAPSLTGHLRAGPPSPQRSPPVSPGQRGHHALGCGWRSRAASPPRPGAGRSGRHPLGPLRRRRTSTALVAIRLRPSFAPHAPVASRTPEIAGRSREHWASASPTRQSHPIGCPSDASQAWQCGTLRRTRAGGEPRLAPRPRGPAPGG